MSKCNYCEKELLKDEVCSCAQSMEQKKKEYGCPKCGCKEAVQSEIATTGSGLSRIFDLQHNHFSVVSCKNCGYSELYRTNSSLSGNILDLFFGR